MGTMTEEQLKEIIWLLWLVVVGVYTLIGIVLFKQ
jgi:hypothetical protein